LRDRRLLHHVRPVEAKSCNQDLLVLPPPHTVNSFPSSSRHLFRKKRAEHLLSAASLFTARE
jgi:hypothetical protein